MAHTDANLEPNKNGYISAHGTATVHGDQSESIATHNIFGKNTPISSLKSYFGHTLGACGAIEAWLSIMMMNNNIYAPTANLENTDPNCMPLDHIQKNPRDMNCEYIMSNNFAFGGINTSLVFKRV